MESWERYVYRVEWSEEDGEFVGLCAELPGLSWLAPTQSEALVGIVATARDSVEILKADGEPLRSLSRHAGTAAFSKYGFRPRYTRVSSSKLPKKTSR